MISQLFTQILAKLPGYPEVVGVVATGRGHTVVQGVRGEVEYRDHQG